jgi:DNA-binding response OmpR family regulator
MSLILVVEDELSVAEVIADALTPLHHAVSVAVTARDALAIAAIDRPDVILLDMNLPDSSGTATLERLRHMRPDVPIIMVTGNADEDLARAVLNHRAFDYVTKPFNLDRLLSVVEAALASR